MASLKAEPAPVARVGDGEEGEEVAGQPEEDVEGLEGQGERNHVVGALQTWEAVLGRVVGEAEVAVLDDVGLVAHRHVFRVSMVAHCVRGY